MGNYFKLVFKWTVKQESKQEILLRSTRQSFIELPTTTLARSLNKSYLSAPCSTVSTWVSLVTWAKPVWSRTTDLRLSAMASAATTNAETGKQKPFEWK